MNRRPSWQLRPAPHSPLSSSPPPPRPAPSRPSPEAASSDAKPRPSSRWLWFTYMASALAVIPGLVLWDTHQTRQITQVEDLGLAKDIPWLGTSGKRWVCDASMQHCLRTAGEPHTLRAGQPS